VIHRKTENERQLANGEKGRGRSQIIRQRESLFLSISLNILFSSVYLATTKKEGIVREK
jgi:hypothetical protein